MASEKCSSNGGVVAGQAGWQCDAEHQDTFKRNQAHWWKTPNLSGFAGFVKRQWKNRSHPELQFLSLVLQHHSSVCQVGDFNHCCCTGGKLQSQCLLLGSSHSSAWCSEAVRVAMAGVVRAPMSPPASSVFISLSS